MEDPISFVIVGFDYIIAIFLFQIGLLFIRQWAKETKKQFKNTTILGFGLYFTFFAIGLCIVFYITNHEMSALQFDIYFILSIYLRGFAGVLLAFILERTIQTVLRTRYLISLTLIGLLCLVPFFIQSPLLYSLVNAINLVLIILPLGFTLYFIKNTSGVNRQKFIISIPGFLLFGVGLYITTPKLVELIETTFSFSLIVILSAKLIAILGIALIIYGFNGYSFFLDSEWRENAISLYIIDKKRLNILYHKNFLKRGIESEEIFAGGISGIESIIEQITKTSEGIDVIKLEDKLILLSHGEKIITALIAKKNIQNARYILKEITKQFEFFFWDYLKYYESYSSILTQSEIFKPMEMLIRNLIKL